MTNKPNDNTVAEQSKINENNEEFRHYEAAKVKEYEDWLKEKNTEIEEVILYNANEKRGYSVYYDEDLDEKDENIC
jgi:hypothetical protein